MLLRSFYCVNLHIYFLSCTKIKDLNKKEIQTLRTKLQNEFAINNIDEYFLNNTFLKVTDLSIKDSSTHTKGKISEILNAKFPGLKINPDSIYKSIFDEVRRKSKHDKIVTTLDELIRNKGVGKKQFEEILSAIGAVKDFDKLWLEITSTLSNEGLRFGDIQIYKTQWKKLEVDRMDPTNKLLQDTIKKVKKRIDFSRTNFSNKSLMEIVGLIKADLLDINVTITNDYLTVLIFSEIYE